MRNGSKRRTHPSVLSGTYFLEDRVLMSTISHTTLPVPAALVDKLPHIRHELVHNSTTRTQSATRVADRPSGHPTAIAVSPTVRRWSWLANTYWYVPPMNLPALLYNSSTGTLIPVTDQTVFHITGYREGYFWGKAVTQLGSSAASTSTMIGSVTPEDQVLLTFTQTSTNSSPSITEGFGKMQRKFGQWTMENQMFTSPSETLQIGHWAYMLQTRPGMPSWNSLPSAGVSVPEFLSE
jgi:hypothetical protein